MTDVIVAQGTTADLEEIVGIHLRAFAPDENVATALGPGTLRAVYRWFMADPGAVVLLARSHGTPVGFTSLVDRSYTIPLGVRVLPHAAAALVRHPGIVASPLFRSRLARLANVFGRDRLDGARIAYTAVVPDARGRGVGGRLKEASIEWCRERGIPRMITGIRVSNTASRRMNERAGFTEVPELRHGDMLIYALSVDHEAGPGNS